MLLLNIEYIPDKKIRALGNAAGAKLPEEGEAMNG